MNRRFESAAGAMIDAIGRVLDARRNDDFDCAFALQVIKARGDEGVTEDELSRILDKIEVWAMEATAISLVLKGVLDVSCDPGETELRYRKRADERSAPEAAETLTAPAAPSSAPAAP